MGSVRIALVCITDRLRHHVDTATASSVALGEYQELAGILIACIRSGGPYDGTKT